MLETDPPEDEDDPVDEPPDEDPPDPPPDGRDTAVPLELPLAGRDSGRSFACPANAGPTLSENVAAAAHNVTARRVMMCSKLGRGTSSPDPLTRLGFTFNGEPKPAIPQNEKAMHLPAEELVNALKTINLAGEVS